MKHIYKTQTSDCEVDPVKSSKAQSPRNMAHIYCLISANCFSLIWFNSMIYDIVTDSRFWTVAAEVT